jgi:Methyltransferase domain
MTDLIERVSAYQAAKGQHWAGTCTGTSLAELERVLTCHFGDRPIRTVETGCGASTVVFAQYAAEHTVYCYDDRDYAGGSSVLYAQSFPGFREEAVRWVFGPTQRTIFAEPLDRPVDVIQIDGPHGYPFPELEYFAFIRWLTHGGVLIVDDIHIPSINNMYQFLLQDDGFRVLSIVQTTAFLERTQLPVVNLEGDDWWLQRYNVQSFPLVRDDAPVVGFELPVTVRFDQRLTKGDPILTKGFSLLDAPPVSEGPLSQVTLRLAKPAPARVTVAVDLEPVAVEQREDCGFQLCVGRNRVGEYRFETSARRTLSFDLATDGVEVLTLDFFNEGLLVANDLMDWNKSAWYDGRQPNFKLHAISLSEGASANPPGTIRRADGSIATFNYEGREFSFFVDDCNDLVEAFHAAGRFYGVEVLEQLRSLLPSDASILDVGAHVGNHTVYFAGVMDARRVVAVEPSPRRAFLLRTNSALNRLCNVDLGYVGMALGRGPVPVQPGDGLFANEEFDLINIDVAGMELDVLHGLGECIARSRPLLSIEISDDRRDDVLGLLHSWDFGVIWERQFRPGASTYVATPATMALAAGAATPRRPLLAGFGQRVRNVHRRVAGLASRP